nr:MAG TPA: hypothetical protein [Caudoviricetes sp.]
MINDTNNIANQIAKILADNKTKINDLDYIWMNVKSLLIVGSVQST